MSSPPHHNFVLIALIIMKFGTGIKLDAFYRMITKTFVTSLLLRILIQYRQPNFEKASSILCKYKHFLTI